VTSVISNTLIVHVTYLLTYRATDVFAQHRLKQHAIAPTHVSGDVLDLTLTRDDDASCNPVSHLATSSMCFSDHHLITCRIGVAPTAPVLMTCSYRQIRRWIDTAGFCNDVLCSRLYDCSRWSSTLLHLVPSDSSSCEHNAASDVRSTTTPSPHWCMRLSPAASTTVSVYCLVPRRRRQTSCNASSTSRIEPRQVRPRTDPVPAPHSTLARRRRPDSVQAVRPSVQVSAQHGSRISG